MESTNRSHKKFVRYGAITAAFVLVIAFALQALVYSSATTQPRTLVGGTLNATNGGSLYGQSYYGGLIGSELYENNTFPFAAYASTSTILALPEISLWLAENNYTIYDLRPYLTLYPSGGNPYDFSQGTARENGTTYFIYEYLIVNSPVGLVMGTWTNSANSTDVGKIFTYDTCGSGIAYSGLAVDLSISPSSTADFPATCSTDVP